MKRVAAAMLLSAAALAQGPRQAEIAGAAKSPVTLARYIESHPKDLDWDALWIALGAQAPRTLYSLCGDRGVFLVYACSTEIVTVLNPDQAILIIQSNGVRTHDIYLRYLQQPDGGWRFAGVRAAVLYDDYPRRHEVARVGGKPLLKISSDLSQVGGGFSQEVEDWFDLTLPDFEPVFSFTADGSFGSFGASIGRQIRAQAIPLEGGRESIGLTLNVAFTGFGRDLGFAMYTGIYERPATATKFTLQSAHLGFDSRESISTTDFEALGGTGPANEQALVYALAGLQEIANGSDADARGRLRSVLDQVKDTPEKRSLLELLRK